MSLVIQDFGGSNSADIEKSRSMIMRAGSWKKQRVIVIVPTDIDHEEVSSDGKRVSVSGIPGKVYLSHVNLIFPPNNGVVRILAQGMEVGHAYSSAVDQILSHPDLNQFEALLTVEHDNLPPQDGVIKLFEALENHPEFSAISGLYFTKGEGGIPQIWGDPKDPQVNFRPQPPQAESLVECCGIGMGFALWRLSMFKDARLRRPWFVTKKAPEGCSTQDLYFWMDARKYGYRCAVHCGCRVGHIDAKGFIW